MPLLNIKICRICLIQEVKMYEYVKDYYEEITNQVVNDADGMPQWFCFECAMMLLKFHRFKQKCYKGLRVLKDLLEKGPLTSDVVNQINRKSKGLESSLQVTCESNIRVKTFIIDSFNLLYIKNNIKDENYNKEISTKNRPSGVYKTITIDKRKKEPEIEKIFTDETDKFIKLNDKTMTSKLLINSDEKDSETNKTYEINAISLVNDNDISNKESMVMTRKDRSIDANKFKRSIKKKFLNPNHWKKINLTDEDAEKEFKAKEVNQTYLKANYKCSECFRGFSQEEMLKRHMKIKHCMSLGPFECRFCRMRVKWKSRLQKHIKEHYTRYKCLRCELSFPVEETAFKHDEFHNGITRTCLHCGEQFRHSSSFYTHLRKHRSKHVCTICGISFLSEFGLYMHKKVKHILTSAVNKTSEAKENMFCKVCNIKFDTRGAYEEHLAQSAMHTISFTDEADCTPQPLKWRYTKRRAPRKCTNCTICDQNFSSYVAYSKHHLTEHADMPLTTNPCRPNVRKICEICGISVAPVSLASHINTHTRAKRYTCNMCGTQLSSKSCLNRHRLTHTGEKPNKCGLCNNSFALTTNMKLHYRTVHMKESLH